MTRLHWILLGAFVATALLVLMPLSLAISMFGLAGQGLSARAATGTIWSGQLVEARIGAIAIGDARVAVKPLSVLTGSTTLAISSPVGKGMFGAPRNGFLADAVTARFGTAGRFAPLPLDTLELTNLSVAFAGPACTAAQGRVRASFSGEVGGLSLAQGLSGSVRCDNGTLLLPLVSQSAMERLDLRIRGDGRYRGELFVRSTDPAMAATLGSAGFTATRGGFALRFAGKL